MQSLNSRESMALAIEGHIFGSMANIIQFISFTLRSTLLAVQ